MLDAIVVGCGVAGLAAISKLNQYGFNVLGLEASDAVGGRVRTENFGDGIVELGAEWIHGEKNNIVNDIAREANIVLTPDDIKFQPYRSNGQLGDFEVNNELFTYCSYLLDNLSGKENQTVENYMVTKFKDYIDNTPHLSTHLEYCMNFFNWFHLYVNTIDATDHWGLMSTKGAQDYKKCDGPSNLSWNRAGYKTLLSLLMRQKSEDTPMEIQFNKIVDRIVWHSNEQMAKVEVHCTDGSLYVAKAVILTISLGILKESAESLFNPPLPADKLAAIQKISFGTVNKICLSYEKPWWMGNSHCSFIWIEEDKNQVADDYKWILNIFGATFPKGSTNTLSLWTSGSTARAVESMNIGIVKKGAQMLLDIFCGKRYYIPEATDIIRSTWFSNPYIRGSYSYHGFECDAGRNPGMDLAEPLRNCVGLPLVMFAGEATSPNYYSTVHGALHTGYREADRYKEKFSTSLK